MSFFPLLPRWRIAGWLAAATIIIAPDADDAMHRALGADRAYDAVVRIDRGSTLGGTGSLIAPEWVLTAAHVVAGQSLDTMRVIVGTRTIAVRRAIAHPDWHRRIDDPDLALIQLAERVTSVTPLAIDSAIPILGAQITLVGYGAGGVAGRDRGVKRGATNRIDQVGGETRGTPLSSWHVAIDFDDGAVPLLNALGDATPTRLEGINSGGDSGGPWLIPSPSGWRIAAVYHVTSYNIGQMTGATPRFGGAVAMGVGVAPFRHWIDSTLTTSAR